MNLEVLAVEHGSAQRNKKLKSLSIPDIFKILDCSKHIMIGIYWIEQEQFWYCNKAFNSGIRRDLGPLIDMSWQRLYDCLDQKELPDVKKRINNFICKPFERDTMQLDYKLAIKNGSMQRIRHEMALHEIKGNSMVINYFHEILDSDINLNKAKEQVGKISDRERQVLLLIADGFSSKEIADKLCISNHTAISHRKNLIEKFKVKNTAQLVKEAFQLI